MFSLLFESIYSTLVWLIKNLGDYFTHYIIITVVVYVKYQNSFRFRKTIFIPMGQSEFFFFFCQYFKQTPQVFKFWLNL